MSQLGRANLDIRNRAPRLGRRSVREAVGTSLYSANRRARTGPRPPHGPAGRPLDLLCRVVAELPPWMTYSPGVLVRTHYVHPSAASKLSPTNS
jgi:hypothetical protein